MSIETPDQLRKALSEMRDELGRNGADLGKVKLLADELKEGMAVIRKDNALKDLQIEAARNSAKPDEVVARYFEDSADDEVAPWVATKSHKLGYGDGGRDQGTAKFIGSENGVVRLLGGEIDGEWEHGLLDDPNPQGEWQVKLQQMHDDYAFIRFIKPGGGRKQRKRIAKHWRAAPPQIRRVFADNPGEGAEFIPDVVSPVLRRTAELTRVVEGLFPTISLRTGGVTRNPFHDRGLMMYIHGVPDPGDFNPGNLRMTSPVTAERTVEPITYTAATGADLDAAEDSIIAWAPYARLNLAEVARDAFEDAILNSDTPYGTHQDAIATWNPRNRWQSDKLVPAQDHRTGFVGLRARAFDVGGDIDLSASQTIKAYAQNLAKLDVPHAFQDVVFIVTPEHFLAKMIVDDDVRTLDKLGPRATQITGQLGQMYGRPIFLSEFMTGDLESSGLYTDGSGARGGIVALNRRRFVVAVRRGLSIGSETVLRQHTNYWVASMRKTFHTFDDGSTKNVLFYRDLDTQ
jgi:hypothetical protein